MSKTAIIIGATGLVGNKLTNLLLEDNTFDKVKIFVRRTTGLKNTKLEEHIIDFDKITSYKDLIHGEVLFSCLGTTIKQAGSKEDQYKVDYTYQYLFAEIASANNVPVYSLVSSPSANSKSRIFYTKIKGELEDKIKELAFEKIQILQPSVLIGERPDKRTGEVIAGKIINFLSNFLPFVRKYKGIEGEEVAASMLRIYNSPKEDKINYYILDELFKNG